MFLARLRYKLSSHVPRMEIPVENLISTVILILIVVFLSTNLARRVHESTQDYAVYLAEQEALAKLTAENKQLQDELDYYNSIEYRLLYARDSLNSVQPGEKLYELSKDIVIYSYQPEPVRIYEELEKLKIWQSLLIEGWM